MASHGFVIEMYIAIACLAAYALYVKRSSAKESFAQAQYVGIDYERLYAVVTAFRKVLERAPTEEELQRYESKLSSDPEFDVPALEHTLRQSAEFKRLTGLQKNSNVAEIDGVVSEQAIRGKLEDIYYRITKQKPDSVTMDLLYSRYRHTNLSDAYITALIQQMAAGPSGALDRSKNALGASVGHTEGASTRAGSGTNAAGQDKNSFTIEKNLLKSLGLTDEELRGSPRDIIALLRAKANSCKTSDIDKDNYKRREICARDRQRMLDTINYNEGLPMGTWTMPYDRNTEQLYKSRRDHSSLRASPDQTELIGTLLSDINTSKGLVLAP